jgi:alanine-glyoxylate transaminase/serine-glyoxylate transaminase/serine-pyruvate transaminase
VELRVDDWEIDVCISASQKCLEGPPGFGLVAVREHAWERISSKATRGWYLCLQNWADYAEAWADWHPFPITLAVPAFRGLRCGLDAILREGLEARWQRHRQMAAWAEDALAPAGYVSVFPTESASPTVLAFTPPEGLDVEELRDQLRTADRILVAGGMGAFKGRAFRVGNMGPQASKEELGALIAALVRIAGQRKELGK